MTGSVYLSKNGAIYLSGKGKKGSSDKFTFLFPVPNLCPVLTALYGFLWYYKVLYGTTKNPETIV
jgi:hypothetical protein